MKKDSLATFLESPTADFINLLASLFGIFGFLTGIASFPYLLGYYSDNPDRSIVAWFGSSIPLAISIPIFILSLIFVYVLYFFMLVKVYRWMYRSNYITGNTWTNHIRYFMDKPDYFSIIVFKIVGICITTLCIVLFLYPSWENLPTGSEATDKVGIGAMAVVLYIFIIPPLWWFLDQLCKAAREVGVNISTIS